MIWWSFQKIHIILKRANGKIRKIRPSVVKAQNVPQMCTVRYKHVLDLGHKFDQELSSN